ncbi:MAG: response regulator transcription factor [Burkholderiales bacterium]|jgi:DNA-binding NarL/FixJ family response regulator|nr:response regulator transcription factor [Burkholderiales bacterium]MBP6250692.1 response regulator transcription factor [Leptothrix sp. (in: b-proteobacteria)]MBP7520259.1 response regulator transcription factor [Leptothrix sp. (in: b-proteobacteria)]HQY10165.1 response regulator transcription factor [Burkholderiaceae bacterium]
MKILLIDDHPLILSAMRYVIRDLDEAVEVTGVESVVQARSVLGHNTDFDLILLDLYLGEVHGFDFLSELRLRHPAIPVVVISGSDRASDVIRAIDTGAMGFVPKRASNQLLFEALHLVMSGGIYVPPMLEQTDHGWSGAGAPAVQADQAPLSEESRSARIEYPPGDPGDAPPPAPVAPSAAAPLSVEGLGLTARQCEVLTRLLQGKSNKGIAREMNLSVETVKDHVAAVLRSLGVNSRTQAVLAVSQLQAGGRQALRPVRP